MPTDPRTVYVSAAATPALGEPQFVIEHKGRLYLTVAVLEYESDARLSAMLSSGTPVRAVAYEGGPAAVQFANTDPEI